MTANGRGTMRPQGRAPPFLLVGLLVVMCILGYSYWSVASTSSDQASQIVTLQDEVRILSTRKMEADKRSESSNDQIRTLEKRNTNLMSELQEKVKAMESVKSELSRKEEDLRNSNTELDNKAEGLTKCEQDSNGIKEELQKLKEETESLKGSMDKKPAQCDQNSCEEPIRNILTVLVNSLGRQQIIATLQSNNIDANKFIPAEGVQQPGVNPNLQPLNPAGQPKTGDQQPVNNQGQPAGVNQQNLGDQQPPKNPADPQQLQNSGQQPPQNPADPQQLQNAGQQPPQNPADPQQQQTTGQQPPQNPADPQQLQNAGQQPPQNAADPQQLQNAGQQPPQNPADQPQQGLNVVPQPNVNQEENPGQQNVVGVEGKGGISEHEAGVSAGVNSSAMHEQGNREVPSSEGKADSIAVGKESNVTTTTTITTTSGEPESKETRKTEETKSGGLLKGLLANARGLETDVKGSAGKVDRTETTKAGEAPTTNGTSKEGPVADSREPAADVTGSAEELKDTETTKSGTNGTSKIVADGEKPAADDKETGDKDKKTRHNFKEGQGPVENFKGKEGFEVLDDFGKELKRLDKSKHGDKDAANQEAHLNPADPLHDGRGQAIPLLAGDGDNIAFDNEEVDDKVAQGLDSLEEEGHKEGDDKLKFEPLGEELKHQGDIEKDEDAIDRMNDNMALEDKKPEAAYKIEESEGI
ncbi:pinin-like [Haliotis cracherodii]|uniref:pinin-like n=1 Tax=Haliotis cracherodii TaxID=6455 RepID=UPI0039EADA3F